MDTAKKGFAALSPDLQREIARKGGQSVPAEKRSFSQDRQLAAKAGRVGGLHRHNPPAEEPTSKETDWGPDRGREII